MSNYQHAMHVQDGINRNPKVCNKFHMIAISFVYKHCTYVHTCNSDHLPNEPVPFCGRVHFNSLI